MMPLPLPWSVAGAAVLAPALFVAGYLLGQDDARTDCRAERGERLTRAIAQAEALARQDAEVLTAHETARTRVRATYIHLTREAHRYALDHRDSPCGLDADGLRLWAAANAGDAEPLAAAAPDYRLRDTAGPGLGPAGGPADQSRRGDGAPARVPGAAPGAGGVGATMTGEWLRH